VGFFNLWGIKLSEFYSEFDSLSHLPVHHDEPLEGEEI